MAGGFYGAGVGVRNFLYAKGGLQAHRSTAVVISVGNITAGGTGKTPLVIWLCSLLRQKKAPFAILTRGYRTSGQVLSDEPAILAESCADGQVVVNADRVAGAAEAVERFGAKVLVMDDGFQHRRLGRDLDIVTIDATCPFGYGRMLPAGLLREPVESLKRADAAVITRSDQVDPAEVEGLERELRQISARTVLARSVHAPVCVKSVDGRSDIAMEQLGGKKVFAFCGIGNPEGFLRTVRVLGAELAGCEIYDDHHSYSDDDIRDVCRKAAEVEADLILTTEKDRSKIAGRAWGEKRIAAAYLRIELRFTEGEDRIRDLIEGALAGRIGGDRI